MKKQIYLDYAAATPMRGEVIKAMEPYWSDKFYNPSANYLAARAVRHELEDYRARVGQILGAKPGEIIFTAGATEANNLAIAGVLNQSPNSEVIISGVEHESVIEPARRGKCRVVPVDTKGIVDLAKLEKLVTDQTVLVSIIYVSNELGVIQPLAEVAQLLNKLRNLRKQTGNKLPLYLHSDAAQAANYLDIHVARLGVDLMNLNGGKLYGPKQSGVLYVKAGTKLQPLIVGGGQELGYRSGTENISAIAGLTTALELAQDKHKGENKRLTQLRDYFEELVSQLVPNAQINGLAKHRAPHITSLTVAGIDNERAMMQLDEAGVICAVGSACAASKQAPSPTLLAIGLSAEQAQSTLRFSFGYHTTKAEIESAARLLADTVNT